MEMDGAETLYPNSHVSTTHLWAFLYPTSSWAPGSDPPRETPGNVIKTVHTWKAPFTHAWSPTQDNLIKILDFMAGELRRLTSDPIPPREDVSLLQLQFGRPSSSVFRPSPNGHGISTEGVAQQLSAEEMAMLPGASTTTETVYVKLLPNGGHGPASFLTSTHRIMTAIPTPPPPGAHVYWDTVAWKTETRVITAPNYGTLTEDIWWSIVEREVHRGSGFPIVGLQRPGAFASDQMEPTTWSQTVYAEAGGQYGEWKMPSEVAIDKWLVRRVTRMRLKSGCTMIPQCAEKHKKKKVIRVAKRKKITVRFVKKGTRRGKEETSTHTD